MLELLPEVATEQDVEFRFGIVNDALRDGGSVALATWRSTPERPGRRFGVECLRRNLEVNPHLSQRPQFSGRDVAGDLGQEFQRLSLMRPRELDLTRLVFRRIEPIKLNWRNAEDGTEDRDSHADPFG